MTDKWLSSLYYCLVNGGSTRYPKIAGYAVGEVDAENGCMDVVVPDNTYYSGGEDLGPLGES